MSRQRTMPRVTRRGRTVFAAGIAVLVAGCVADSDALVQLALFAILLPAVALGLSYLNLHGVVLNHVLPEFAFRNQPFEIELALRNDGRILDRFDVNVRHEALARRDGRAILFRRLPAYAKIAVEREALFARRGVHGEFRYTVSSDFPLGLATHRLEGHAPGTVTVCPVPRLPADAARLLEGGMGLGGAQRALSADVVGDLKSLREFRTGDHPKRISWPFSARFQTVIVRELEQPAPESVTVCFHSYQPAGVVLSRRSFERALELVAGLCVHLGRLQAPFDLVAPFTEWRRVPVMPESGSERRALELLAAAPFGTCAGLDDVNAALRESGQHGLAIVVSNAPVRLWRGGLIRTGLRLVCVDTGLGGRAPHAAARGSRSTSHAGV